MDTTDKNYHDVCPVFNDFGKKWIVMHVPYEETTIGDRYEMKFRRCGSNDEYLTHIATLYADRFTDRNELDIPMDDYDVEEGELFEIEATKIDK